MTSIFLTLNLIDVFKVKDVRVPEQLQRAMAAEAEAAREARAKVEITVIFPNIILIVNNIITIFLTTATIIFIIIKLTKASCKVIAAEGEHKASRALRHAAEVIAECPAALQVMAIVMEMVMSLVMSLVTMMFHCQNSD